MAIILLGRFILIRLEQPSNELYPMVVTLLGKVIVTRFLQLINALVPIIVTVSGMTYELAVSLLGYRTNVVFDLLYNMPTSSLL